MGGWYSWAPLEDIGKPGNNGFAPGHSFGQYLSGLSRDYAATGDKQTQEKVHRLVRNFAPAISGHFWDGNRFPAYTYDKPRNSLTSRRAGTQSYRDRLSFYDLERA